MRAARYYGTGDVRIEEIEERPVPAEGVRIEIDACGICGTDVSQYASRPTAVPMDEPHPVTGATAPVTLGHEFSGTVVETGDTVDKVETGDTVAVNPIVPCRECDYCRRGSYRLCDQISNIGLHGNDGGFAETAVVPATNVIRLSAGFPTRLGPLIEPLSVSLHAVRQAGLSAGDRVAVFGAGPIGIGIVQAARAAGAREVFVSEPRDARRTLAGEVGGTELLDPLKDDVVQVIRDTTDVGVDLSFEAAGAKATVTAAIRSTRKGGRIVAVAAAQDATVHPNSDFVLTERSLIGSFAYECVPYSDRGEFGTVIQMLGDGRIDGDAMISDNIGLDELVPDGLAPLANQSTDAVKIIVHPDR